MFDPDKVERHTLAYLDMEASDRRGDMSKQYVAASDYDTLLSLYRAEVERTHDATWEDWERRERSVDH